MINQHAKAFASGTTEDWMAFYQAFSGTALIVPLLEKVEDSAQPVTVEIDGIEAVIVHVDMDSYAANLTESGEYAEIAGVELAAMLAGQGTALSLHASPPIVIGPDQLAWIAQTFGAEVTRATGAGVAVKTPELPALEVMEQLGKTVGALGADCPEAWLVSMTAEGEAEELVLVLGLKDAVRKMEGQIAETVTRAIQAVTDQPFAVACPDRGAPLMDAARKNGIGIGG
jgi:hypothetical protein